MLFIIAKTIISQIFVHNHILINIHIKLYQINRKLH